MLDAQTLGQRLGEALAPTPSNAPQVCYGTIDTVNADGTLDVVLYGTTLRGLVATTGCVGADAGLRCVVLRQGPLATVIGIVASADLAGIDVPGGVDIGGSITWGGAGASKDASDTTGKSVPNNSWTELGPITLGAGTWVIVGTCQFQSNATGRRGLNVSTTSGSSTTSAAAGLQIPAASGAQTVISRTWIFSLASSTTYYLNAFQNSGSSLTTYWYLRAVRVA